MSDNEANNDRRGDLVTIPGNYQFNAIHHGFVVQRFWHSLKLKNIERYCLPTSEMKVLDVGCGSGVVTNYLASFAKEVGRVQLGIIAAKAANTKNNALIVFPNKRHKMNPTRAPRLFGTQKRLDPASSNEPTPVRRGYRRRLAGNSSINSCSLACYGVSKVQMRGR